MVQKFRLRYKNLGNREKLMLALKVEAKVMFLAIEANLESSRESSLSQSNEVRL